MKEYKDRYFSSTLEVMIFSFNVIVASEIEHLMLSKTKKKRAFLDLQIELNIMPISTTSTVETIELSV